MSKTASDVSVKNLATVKVKPGEGIVLDDIKTSKVGNYKSKDETEPRLAQLREELSRWQEKLWAEGRQSLLIVLQALDTGGKDGATKHLLTGINPAGVQVTSFKKPTELELKHDFLWRVHAETPPRGYIGIWNRSHYEDVLVPVVHGTISDGVRKRRYRQINDFEEMLVENGTTILKFFLHISKEEQKRRLQARLDDPDKHWKFSEGDLKERAFWKDYQKAFEGLLSNCSTKAAPWYVVPADHKWSRDIELSEIVVETIKGMKPDYPKVELDVSRIRIED
jgi:PPK2 family polyphosphate:nucleotide phosphotransferase